jgi:hypothetical protein
VDGINRPDMMVSVGEIFGVLTHMLVSIGVKPGIT